MAPYKEEHKLQFSENKFKSERGQATGQL